MTRPSSRRSPPPRPRAILPIDRLFVVYNLVIAAAWAVGARDKPIALVAAAIHLGLATVPWIARARTWPTPGARRLADVYPLLTFPALWGELGPLLPLLHKQFNDETIIRLDRALFGIDWHAGGLTFDPPRWLDELMFGAYFSFYALLIVPPLTMLLAGARRAAALRDLVLRVMLMYMVCNLLDIAFPVIGPAGSSRPIEWSHGLFSGLTAAATHLGDALGTSFPSTHVAISAAIAWGAWHWYRPPIAALITADALLIAVSTVYTQNHYVLDVAAGLAVVVVVQGLIVPRLRHATQRGSHDVE